jgi:hypothetical protein
MYEIWNSIQLSDILRNRVHHGATWSNGMNLSCNIHNAAWCNMFGLVGLVWSHKLNFKILTRSDQRLLRYLHYHYFDVFFQYRLSSMGGQLHFMYLSTLV